MSWGASYFYYHCSVCGKKFEYAQDLISVFRDDFGKCPFCGAMGVFEKDGARTPDDNDYFEVEE